MNLDTVTPEISGQAKLNVCLRKSGWPKKSSPGRQHSRVPPLLKGGNPIFEFFKKGGNQKKIFGWGKKKGGKDFQK